MRSFSHISTMIHPNNMQLYTIINTSLCLTDCDIALRSSRALSRLHFPGRY